MKNKLILFALLYIVSSITYAESNPSYYPYITGLYKGPIKYHKDLSNPYDLGVMYRAVITSGEGYYVLAIEKIQVQEGGGLIYISSKLIKTHSYSEIKFIKWKNSSSFEILLDKNVKTVYINKTGEGEIE